MNGGSDERVFDLQPDPRILPMLGEINLLQWRCLAEFIDNAIDGFLSAQRNGIAITTPQISISLPTADLPSAVITVRDNGPGMDAGTLEKAVRAGWTSNDPISSLGMFGMGFNIATARLGASTQVWTTKAGELEWSGLEIDFDALMQQRHFRTPRLSRAKADPFEQGTEISVRRLKPEQRDWFARAGNRSKLSRDHFAVVYSSMLRPNGVPISFRLLVNGTAVTPKNHCIWGGEGNPPRQVATAGYGIVSAYQTVDMRLPEREFCTRCWQWLSSTGQGCPSCGERNSVAIRRRNVSGWLGIQRYAHQSEYGIDFLRNGRKIEIASKDLFYWDAGGPLEPEYPIDDPRNRGRIVGEIHIDHCRVTYTKDRFDRNDPAWEEMTKIVRGEGPLRPARAAELGYGQNSSPLFLLYQAFRRNQPHGKVAKAYSRLLAVKDNDLAESMARRYYAGQAEYQTDVKWWELVEEADRELLTSGKPADPGGARAAIPGFGAQPNAGSGQGPPARANPPGTPATPTAAPIRQTIASLSQEYRCRVTQQVWRVRAYSASRGDAGLQDAAWSVTGTASGEHTFLVDLSHEVFRSATLTPLDALLDQLAYLAVDFSRGGQATVSYAGVLAALRQDYATGSNLDSIALASESVQVLAEVGRSLSRNISSEDARELFGELGPAEQEHVMAKLAARGTPRPRQVIEDGKFLEFSPYPTLLRFFESHPELFLDGRHWDTAFSTLDYEHASATEDAKTRVVRHYSGLLLDAVWLAEQGAAELNAASRPRLLRAALALELLRPTSDAADRD
jgi:hypothetical protein